MLHAVRHGRARLAHVQSIGGDVVTTGTVRGFRGSPANGEITVDDSSAPPVLIDVGPPPKYSQPTVRCPWPAGYLPSVGDAVSINVTGASSGTITGYVSTRAPQIPGLQGGT